MSLSERWKALRTMYHKWSRMAGINRVQVGYERYGLQSDVEYFEEQMAAERRKGISNCTFGITELNWPREGGHSKRERVERLEPDFRNSRFYLPAVVGYNGRVCIWQVQDDPELRDYGQITYDPLQGPTKRQAEALKGGSPDLIVKPIRQRDEDGHIYDLTARFLTEYVCNSPPGRTTICWMLCRGSSTLNRKRQLNDTLRLGADGVDTRRIG
jgi:hypothetical protein